MMSRRDRTMEPSLLTVQRDGKTVCPASKFQKMVSGKYKLRVLWGLQNGWRRYSDIKTGLLTGDVDSKEIAPRVLSRELRNLVTMGMVERKDHHVFQDRKIEIILGVFLFAIGALLVYDAFESRGKKIPWPLGLVAPW